MFSRLVKQMAKREGVTERLKPSNQMARVGAINHLRNKAMEIAKVDLIYS